MWSMWWWLAKRVSGFFVQRIVCHTEASSLFHEKLVSQVPFFMELQRHVGSPLPTQTEFLLHKQFLKEYLSVSPGKFYPIDSFRMGRDIYCNRKNWLVDLLNGSAKVV